METQKEVLHRERAILKEEYGDLFPVVATIMFKLDPMGLNYGTNTDEYDSEVATILPRLKTASSVNDVKVILHEEFIRWFDAEMVDEIENLQSLAEKIWQAWCGYRQRLD